MAPVLANLTLPWMRTIVALWWVVLLLGFATYSRWYIPRSRAYVRELLSKIHFPIPRLRAPTAEQHGLPALLSRRPGPFEARRPSQRPCFRGHLRCGNGCDQRGDSRDGGIPRHDDAGLHIERDPRFRQAVRPGPQITWFSRDGKPAEQIGDPGNLADIRISPDQRRIVFTRADAGPDVWLADLDRGGATRVTFSEGTATSPVFSPDGARIAYASDRPGGSKVLIRPSNLAAGTETVFESTRRVQLAVGRLTSQWLAAIWAKPAGGRPPVAVGARA